MPFTSNLVVGHGLHGGSLLATIAVFIATVIALVIGQIFILAFEVMIYGITFSQDLAAALRLAAPRVPCARYPNLISLAARLLSGIGSIVVEGIRHLGVGSIFIILGFYWDATSTPATSHLLGKESKINRRTSFTAMVFGLVGVLFIKRTLFAIIKCLVQNGLRLVSECLSRLKRSTLTQTRPRPRPQQTVKDRKPHHRNPPPKQPPTIPIPDVPLPPPPPPVQLEQHPHASFFPAPVLHRWNNSPMRYVRDPYPPASASFFRAPLSNPPNPNRPWQGPARRAGGPNVWVPFTPATPTGVPVSTTPTSPPPSRLWREHGKTKPATPGTPSLTATFAPHTASPPLSRRLWPARPKPAVGKFGRRDVGVPTPAPAPVSASPPAQHAAPTPPTADNADRAFDTQPSEPPPQSQAASEPTHNARGPFGLGLFSFPPPKHTVPAFTINPVDHRQYVPRPQMCVFEASLPQGSLYDEAARYIQQSMPAGFVQQSAPYQPTPDIPPNSTTGGCHSSTDREPQPSAVHTPPRGVASPTDHSGWTGFYDVGSSAKAKAKGKAKERASDREEKLQTVANPSRSDAIKTRRGGQRQDGSEAECNHSVMDTTEDFSSMDLDLPTVNGTTNTVEAGVTKDLDLSALQGATNDIEAGVAQASNLPGTSALAQDEGPMDIDWIRQIRAREDDDGDDERINPKVPQPSSGLKRNVRPRQDGQVGQRGLPDQAGPIRRHRRERIRCPRCGTGVVVPILVGPIHTPSLDRPAAGPLTSSGAIPVSRADATLESTHPLHDLETAMVSLALDSDILMDGC